MCLCISQLLNCYIVSSVFTWDAPLQNHKIRRTVPPPTGFFFTSCVVSCPPLCHSGRTVYQFVSLMSVKSKGQGHRVPLEVTMIWPAHTHQTHQVDPNTLKYSSTDRHIFLFGYFSLPFSNYMHPVCLKCWSEKKGDQECQTKGRRWSLSKKSEIFPPIDGISITQRGKKGTKSESSCSDRSVDQDKKSLLIWADDWCWIM